MNYYLQHASGEPPEALKEEIIVRDAVALPRRGDTVELDGEQFTVIHVFHEVKKGKAFVPVVRVQ